VVREGLIYLGHVQAAVANQFSGEQQDRNLVSVAHARRLVGIDIEHIDRILVRRRHGGEFGQQFLAQAAARTRVQDKTQAGARIFQRRIGQGRGRSAPKDFTECAMNSTVSAGTSPTAVT